MAERRSLALLGSLLAAAFFITTPVGVAHATNFGSQGTVGTSGTTNGVFLLTDGTLNICGDTLTATYAAGFNTAMDNQFQPTDLVVNRSVANGCSLLSDVIVFDNDYGNNGLNGWNACVSGRQAGAHPNMTCSLQYTRVNQFFNPPANRIMCHEVGHAVGLRHSGEAASCMRTTADGGTSQTLTLHDRTHINGRY